MLADALAQRLRARGAGAWAIVLAKEGRECVRAGAADGFASAHADTPFYLASLSKAFTAATIGALIERGLYAWDRPLRALVPEFAASVGADITFLDLLSMRTGLATCGAAHFGFRGDFPLEERLRRAAHARRAHAFRAGFSYHNANYVAARLAAERLVERSFSEILTEALLMPLGLEGVSFSPPSSAPGGEVRPDGVLRIPMTSGPNSIGAGGLYASANAIAAWMRWLIAEGGPLASVRTWIAAPHISIWPGGGAANDSFVPPAASWTAYGLGFAVASQAGATLFHHSGNVPGSRCHLAVAPGRGGVCVLASGPHGVARAACFEALHALGLWQADLRAPPDTAFSLARKDARPATCPDGVYTSSEAGRLRIANSGGVARFCFEDCPMHDGVLMQIGEELFLARDAALQGDFFTPEEDRISWPEGPGGAVAHAYLGVFQKSGKET